MTASITIRDFAGLSAEESAALFAEMTPEEKAAKLYDWPFWARPEQLLPDGDWIYWLILAGRGAGKTRSGAEAVRQWIKMGFQYVNLIGATESDVEKVMVKGESGILAICPPDERPVYIGNKHELRWPNGARSLLFSGEKADRLRGNQHEKLWLDELAAWRFADTLDQAMLGLRLGSKPQAVITTTPRPTAIIKGLVKDERTHVTRGSTYDNTANLADAFIHQVIGKYEGTRLGRQELNAEVLEDVPGALFMRQWIDDARDRVAPVGLRRIVVAIDPAISTGENSDETGIVVVGSDDGSRDKDKRAHGYVLDDVSGHYTPPEWAKKALHMYHRYKADAIIAEVNQGGDMVANTIRMFNPNVPVKSVHATRGKAIRAQPIAGLYAQLRIHHVGSFAMLEDQMCSFSPDSERSAGNSPDRLDAMVWAATELFDVEPPVGASSYFTRR